MCKKEFEGKTSVMRKNKEPKIINCVGQHSATHGERTRGNWTKEGTKQSRARSPPIKSCHVKIKHCGDHGRCDAWCVVPLIFGMWVDNLPKWCTSTTGENMVPYL